MKKVIITGSSRGIGRAIAINLARAGYDPVLHCVKNRDALKSVADEIRSLGATGDILQFDIADRAATQAALTAWVETNGAPFGVVLNAGIADDAPFPGLEDDQWDRVLRTDLDGFYNVLKPLVLPMVQARTRGRIIALSSISGVIGNRGQTNYSAAKKRIYPKDVLCLIFIFRYAIIDMKVYRYKNIAIKRGLLWNRRKFPNLC